MPQTVTASRQVPSPYKTVVLANDQLNAALVPNILNDIPGLAFPVVAGGTYAFKFFFTYTSATTGNGSRWTIGGPAITSLSYWSMYTLTASALTINNGLNAYDLPANCNASSLTASNQGTLEGVIKCSASGNVTLRFANGVTITAITVKAGLSYLEYRQIA